MKDIKVDEVNEPNGHDIPPVDLNSLDPDGGVCQLGQNSIKQEMTEDETNGHDSMDHEYVSNEDGDKCPLMSDSEYLEVTNGHFKIKVEAENDQVMDNISAMESSTEYSIYEPARERSPTHLIPKVEALDESVVSINSSQEAVGPSQSLSSTPVVVAEQMDDSLNSSLGSLELSVQSGNDTSNQLERKKKSHPQPPRSIKSHRKQKSHAVVYSSDDDEDSHSHFMSIKSMQSGKRISKKRASKLEYEALHDIENPKPSTSAALVSEMARIWKLFGNSLKNESGPNTSSSSHKSSLGSEFNTPKISSDSTPIMSSHRQTRSRKDFVDNGLLGLPPMKRMRKTKLTYSNNTPKEFPKVENVSTEAKSEDNIPGLPPQKRRVFKRNSTRSNYIPTESPKVETVYIEPQAGTRKDIIPRLPLSKRRVFKRKSTRSNNTPKKFPKVENVNTEATRESNIPRLPSSKRRVFSSKRRVFKRNSTRPNYTPMESPKVETVDIEATREDKIPKPEEPRRCSKRQSASSGDGSPFQQTPPNDWISLTPPIPTFNQVQEPEIKKEKSDEMYKHLLGKEMKWLAIELVKVDHKGKLVQTPTSNQIQEPEIKKAKRVDPILNQFLGKQLSVELVKLDEKRIVPQTINVGIKDEMKRKKSLERKDQRSRQEKTHKPNDSTGLENKMFNYVKSNKDSSKRSPSFADNTGAELKTKNTDHFIRRSERPRKPVATWELLS